MDNQNNVDDENTKPQLDEDQEQINITILEFLSTFHSISTEPQDIADLTDGVALFEALSEMYVIFVTCIRKYSYMISFIPFTTLNVLHLSFVKKIPPILQITGIF